MHILCGKTTGMEEAFCKRQVAICDRRTSSLASANSAGTSEPQSPICRSSILTRPRHDLKKDLRCKGVRRRTTEAGEPVAASNERPKLHTTTGVNILPVFPQKSATYRLCPWGRIDQIAPATGKFFTVSHGTHISPCLELQKIIDKSVSLAVAIHYSQNQAS